jgi:putative ABC transport system substrate-binding protein
MIRRRDFISALGGAAAGWPLAARAQQPAMPVIGVISAGSRGAYAELLAAFRQGLKETGYVEGQTVAIDSRWADGQLDRLPGLAADLVQRRVAVIVTTGGSSSRAAKAASRSIPIVFLSQSDPINAGLVANFNRPGGNATGMALTVKQLQAAGCESLRAIADGLDTRGIPAARGGKWSAVQVSRLLARLAPGPFGAIAAAA